MAANYSKHHHVSLEKVGRSDVSYLDWLADPVRPDARRFIEKALRNGAD